MEERELRIALSQILDNFQRCGLRRIHHDPSQSGPIERALENWRKGLPNQATASPPHPSVQLPSPGETELTVPQSLRPMESPQNLPAEINWSTPDMPDEERKQLFSQLDNQIKACRLCSEICRHRQQTVFGSGPIRPTVCFMGEAPGADEDRVGQPFVGRAGQLLTKIINAMQLKREEVYILNSLKCRPPDNRTPTDQEVANCRPFVQQQLDTLRPAYIVCLGSVAVRSLLNQSTSIGRLRGKFFQYSGAKVVVTYHPAYLLRNEDAKRLVWEDMQMLMKEMGIPTPNRNPARNG